MKTKEKIKINIILFVIMTAGFYLLCCALSLIEKIFLQNPVLIIVLFAFIILHILNSVRKGEIA